MALTATLFDTCIFQYLQFQRPRAVICHQQCLPRLRLFVLLGPGCNHVVRGGHAIALRPSSHHSTICELLNGSYLSRQFMAATPSRSRHWIRYQIWDGRSSGGSTLGPGGHRPPQILPRPRKFFQGNLGLTFPHVNRLR